MRCRIAVPAYLNCRAYFHLPLPAGIELMPMVPSACAPAMARGEIDAGIIPVGGLAALDGAFENLGAYGIGADGAVKSVLCFSRLPFEQLDARHLLRITSESATSVRLLALLLGWQNGFDNLPARLTTSPLPTRADAELVIGDAALRLRRRHGYGHVTDLPAAWKHVTGLPFVFARWVIRRDAPDGLADALLTWLQTFVTQRDVLLRRAANTVDARHGLQAAAAYRYLQGMQTALTPAHLEGQARFTAALTRHPTEFPHPTQEPRIAHA